MLGETDGQVVQLYDRDDVLEVHRRLQGLDEGAEVDNVGGMLGLWYDSRVDSRAGGSSLAEDGDVRCVGAGGVEACREGRAVDDRVLPTKRAPAWGTCRRGWGRCRCRRLSLPSSSVSLLSVAGGCR